MITYLKTGDLLQASVDAQVNTINTAGAMGAGIALQFKKAYPDMFKAYQLAWQSGCLALGKMNVYVVEHSSIGLKYIINFPTKGSWGANSKIQDIESGLKDLVRVIKDLKIQSIALPALGCGYGGLDWFDVQPMIEATFAELPDVDVQVYLPQ